jgi:tRNA-dihydrouridine synthase A
MLDWTDRHCRYFHRLLTRHARLYTEMVTTGALLHGDVARHLDFDDIEHPVALQLGGSDPDDLAHCAKLGARWGYDEINLNCGCPSERVQKGSFGACLMAEPQLVADGFKAMRDAVSIPVTIKHRIGIDRNEDYGFVRDFVGCLFDAGCRVFIVHARNAWLKGLSPKENRDKPPLRYEVVAQLKRDFPEATFVLNGGLGMADAATQVARFDGVMLGRAAYGEPYGLAQVDRIFFGVAAPPLSREEVVAAMTEYLVRMESAGVAPRAVAGHLMGLFQGLPGARQWRRILGDPLAWREQGTNLLRAAAETITRSSPVSRRTTMHDSLHAAGLSSS